METILAVLVLVIVIAAFAGMSYLYVRSDETRSWRDWFVVPASLRQTVGNLAGSGSGASRRAGDDTGTVARQTSEGEPARMALAYDETALRSVLGTLERDLRHDLEDAGRRHKELDARIARVEVSVGEVRGIPDDIGMMVRQRDGRLRREVEQLRHELEGVRRGATAAGQRRDEVYSELYGHLARIEGAIGSALDPMFLPGEPLRLPDELPPVTLEEESWDEVGEHALAFGKAFNQNRLVLDRQTAGEIEAFLVVLREAMMTAVYPTVKRGTPGRAHLVQMRDGLASIIAALTPVRRRLEQTYGEAALRVTRADDRDSEDDA